MSLYPPQPTEEKSSLLAFADDEPWSLAENAFLIACFFFGVSCLFAIVLTYIMIAIYLFRSRNVVTIWTRIILFLKSSAPLAPIVSVAEALFFMISLPPGGVLLLCALLSPWRWPGILTSLEAIVGLTLLLTFMGFLSEVVIAGQRVPGTVQGPGARPIVGNGAYVEMYYINAVDAAPRLFSMLGCSPYRG
ncbi:hypothetical protein GGR52DRAFT_572732 [Hypoxylon sp. FL1284]|nr:hypothetical protein GGR52DRAFT_572732 [Hypoxylon sp. FL1284]